MAGLFLSHSSADKSFVHRLAIDLVGRGMPIWFDTWEMDTGDSLRGKIYSGLGESDYVIVVLSPNSVASGWVERELTAALTLEERHGRNFVLPIRIADCEIPLAIGDRLYADFSASYLEPFERLVSRLQRLGLDRIDEPPEHALVPLIFEKGVYLDGVQLERRVRSLRPRLPAGFEFRRDQFVIAPDERYTGLRRRMVSRAEHIEDDPYYSPEFSRSFSQNYHSFIDMESRLLEGIRLIVNGHLATPSLFDVGLACHWFARDVRSQLLYLLWSSQNPDLPDRIDFGKDCEPLPFASNHSAARFLEVDAVLHVDVGPRDEDAPEGFVRLADSEMVAIEEDSTAARNIEEAGVCSVHSVGNWELYSKYLIPQLVKRHLVRPAGPFTLTFDGWFVGVP